MSCVLQCIHWYRYVLDLFLTLKRLLNVAFTTCPTELRKHKVRHSTTGCNPLTTHTCRLHPLGTGPKKTSCLNRLWSHGPNYKKQWKNMSNLFCLHDTSYSFHHSHPFLHPWWSLQSNLGGCQGGNCFSTPVSFLDKTGITTACVNRKNRWNRGEFLCVKPWW